MNKKNWLLLLLACTFTLAFNACKKSDDTDTAGDTGPTEWVKSTVFTGDPRSNAAYFQIGDKGYIATGILRNNTRLQDAWSFADEKWSRLADFPGSARQGAVGFAVGGKGYVGLGFNGTEVLKDFYSYDPATNKWTLVAAPFPGEARFGAVAFTLGNVAYVGLGSNSSDKTYSDLYKFDPSNNTWSTVDAKFESKRVNAFAFVIGNKAYIGGGIDNGQYPSDFVSFDGTTWTKLNPLNRSDNSFTYDVTRQGASTFVLGSNGYVVGGRKASVLGSIWKYDPSSDSWSDNHQVFQGAYREGAVSFSIAGKGYLAAGSGSSSSKFDDNWVFTPVR